MTESPLAAAQRLFAQAVDALRGVAETGSATERVSVLTLCETVARQLDQVTVATVAGLDREGVFVERGYRSPVQALSDLVGWERFEAHRRVTAAEQVTPRTGLDGSVLPARLAATAEVFAAGRTSLRHVQVIARLLGSDAAGRISPQQWAGVEAQLAGMADSYTPTELHGWGKALIELLDQDGKEPDDRPRPPVNELFLSRLPDGGGKIKGRFEDAATFDAIAAVIDAHAKPLTADDDRSTAERQAEALADVCGYVLDHGDVPEAGGHRPHVNVLIRLEDLENRAQRRLPGLRRAGRGGVAADAVLRRGSGADRDERPGPTARRGTGHPHHPGRPPPRGRSAGSRVLSPRLRPTALVVRGPPPDTLGARWCDSVVQLGHAVPSASSPDPLHRLGLPDPRRSAGVHPASVD